MAKRKCGTCEHFKDGGIAGSGWCQHPVRRDLQHMVLVRKTELACRNPWDQDLWEASGSTRTINSSPELAPLPIAGAGSHASIPLTLNLMSPTEAADRLRTGDLYTDKVTSISMPLRPSSAAVRHERHEDRYALDNARSTADDEHQLPESREARSAVREARRRRQEQRTVDQRLHLERASREAGSLLESGSGFNDAFLPVTSDAERSFVEDIVSQPAPLQESTVEIAAHQETFERSKLIPERPRRMRPQDEVRFTGTPDRFGGKHVDIERAEIHDEGNDRKNNSKLQLHRNGQELPLHGETAELPVAALRAALGKPPIRACRDQDGTERRAERISRTDRAVSSDVTIAPALPERPQRWITGAGSIPLTKTRVRPPSAEPPLPVAFDIDPIDRDNGMRAVPRCCGTCRDFKCKGDSSQGWCTNPYVTTHMSGNSGGNAMGRNDENGLFKPISVSTRRDGHLNREPLPFAARHMIESEGLACRSSVGVWWLPHDDVWLERADTTHHGRPTPMLDGMAREPLASRQEMETRSS